MKQVKVAASLAAGLGLIILPGCASGYAGGGPPIHHHHRHLAPHYGYGQSEAYDRGYHDGVKAGVKDWRRDRRFDYWRHKRYRRGDSGYRSRYGPKSYYREAYRAGFEAGYRLGYGPPRPYRR